MIAIVGAKGGCGKTTTALGVTEALAEAGTPVAAVDADRQLPNLHVVADIEREPTVAAVEERTDLDDVAQPLPGTPEAGVVPGPTEGETVDYRRLLGSLETAPVEVVLDCPTGVGPDVAEPLEAADAAVVVTTDGERSLAAAEKTVSVARDLGVPVAGTVLTRTSRVTQSVRERIDVPVLGAVPEVESPLEADAARRAYGSVAAELKAKSYQDSTGTSHNRMVGRLETGIDVLDRKLDGGLPPGCVVAYTAEPASQSELLLYELTAARGTLYLSTMRSTSTVEHAIESSMAEVGSPTIRQVSGKNPLEEAKRFIGALPEGANLIVDPMDVLERTDRTAYVDFLNFLKDHMLETRGIAVLHCLKGNHAPENRETTEHLVDAVFDLRTTVSATELENHLTIPKFRRGGAPTEAIKLELSERVEIDTSRDIA